MLSWHKLRLLSAPILITLSLSAGCGGRAADEDQPGGSGGRSGAGGGSSAGGMAAGGSPVTAGGSTSAGGSMMTTGGSAQGGAGGCVQNGKVYKVGESFKAGDGCNTCTCFEPGTIGCTLVECPDTCNSTELVYVSAIQEAKRCNPALSREQCTTLEAATLHCACPTFVNPENGAALMTAAASRSVYEQNMCGAGIICGACLEPQRGYCSPEGRCEDTYDTGQTSCLVNGKVYPDGATGIKDPFSCNLCECFGGTLGCTDIGCGTPCPPNTSAGSRCTQCGPAGGCDVVETGCFPACDGTCPRAGELCVNGICRVLCE